MWAPGKGLRKVWSTQFQIALWKKNFFKKTDIYLHAWYHVNSAKAKEFMKALICFEQFAHLQVYDPVRIKCE